MAHPSKPTIGQTGWGTALNNSLDVAYDYTSTHAANSSLHYLPTTWTATGLTVASGWTNVSFSWRFMHPDVVQLRGMMSRGTAWGGGASTVMTLPSGLRNSSRSQNIVVATNSTEDTTHGATVTIAVTTGVVTVQQLGSGDPSTQLWFDNCFLTLT